MHLLAPSKKTRGSLRIITKTTAHIVGRTDKKSSRAGYYMLSELVGKLCRKPSRIGFSNPLGFVSKATTIAGPTSSHHTLGLGQSLSAATEWSKWHGGDFPFGTRWYLCLKLPFHIAQTQNLSSFLINRPSSFLFPLRWTPHNIHYTSIIIKSGIHQTTKYAPSLRIMCKLIFVQLVYLLRD